MSTDFAPDTAPDSAPDTAPAPTTRGRRPRTALLLVGALLLGPVIGGGVGYAVQAGRPPTPLPPLQLTVLPHYPSTVLDDRAAADAAPKPLAIDGDLRKLLIGKPADAQDWDDFGFADGDGWESAANLARSMGNSAQRFHLILAEGFRRTAATSWQKGDVKYLVQLTQYDADHAATAITDVAGRGVTVPRPFANGMEGGYGADDTPLTYSDTTEQYYYALARARRGNVLISVEEFSSTKLGPDEVKDLAQRQWEQLA
ncbi:hypothetical protein P3T37_006832 [Kitasatospora sp. MAA4]|uniref:hypothetical protein n=1 Tax=Kitasatospora sp. MAA4 TaxID=3035093 RepID=UPI0024746ABC|nr:hypothetical protein [Kitasatospora sp. MAA4]MDH6137400.1 hypothetical protein [Kitasatospora sp. MAA4]